MSEVKRLFRPEFLNRLDEIIVFHPLNRAHMEKIIEIQLKDMRKRLEGRGIKLKLTKRAKEFLMEKGFDPVYGARPLKRAIQKYLEDPLSEELLKGKFDEGDTVVVSVKNDKMSFSRRVERERIKDKVPTA